MTSSPQSRKRTYYSISQPSESTTLDSEHINTLVKKYQYHNLTPECAEFIVSWNAAASVKQANLKSLYQILPYALVLYILEYYNFDCLLDTSPNAQKVFKQAVGYFTRDPTRKIYLVFSSFMLDNLYTLIMPKYLGFVLHRIKNMYFPCSNNCMETNWFKYINPKHAQLRNITFGSRQLIWPLQNYSRNSDESFKPKVYNCVPFSKQQQKMYRPQDWHEDEHVEFTHVTALELNTMSVCDYMKLVPTCTNLKSLKVSYIHVDDNNMRVIETPLEYISETIVHLDIVATIEAKHISLLTRFQNLRTLRIEVTDLPCLHDDEDSAGLYNIIGWDMYEQIEKNFYLDLQSIVPFLKEKHVELTLDCCGFKQELIDFVGLCNEAGVLKCFHCRCSWHPWQFSKAKFGIPSCVVEEIDSILLLFHNYLDALEILLRCKNLKKVKFDHWSNHTQKQLQYILDDLCPMVQIGGYGGLKGLDTLYIW